MTNNKPQEKTKYQYVFQVIFHNLNINKKKAFESRKTTKIVTSNKVKWG